MLLATRTLLASTAIICAGALVLAGCAAAASSPSASGTSVPLEAAGASSAPVPSAEPGNVHTRIPPSKETIGMLPPVIVVAGQTEATARVGDTVVINSDTPTEVVVTTDRPDLLEVSQGSYDGSAWFNPGARALAVGTATLTVVHAGTSRRIVVTIAAAAGA